MIVREGFSVPEPRRRAWVTIGFFDGVHRGHQAIMRHISLAARQNGGTSCVVTFNRHPVELLTGKPMRLLTSWEEKARALQGLGIDMVRILSFDRDLASLPASEFLGQLCTVLRVEEIAVGSDFVFGADRQGDIKFLENRSALFGYQLAVVPRVLHGTEKVSSSQIRNWLGAGRIHDVTRGLGRYPTVAGVVIKGRGVGQSLGYPTVNLAPSAVKMLPGAGVYAGFVLIRGTRYGVMVNVGSRPTFCDSTNGVEAHILGFEGNLYDRFLTLHLVERLRDVKKFGSAEELSCQLRLDSQQIVWVLGNKVDMES